MDALGDGAYGSAGSVMARHLFKLYALQDLTSHTLTFTSSTNRYVLEGIQLEQLMNHYITSTAVGTVAKYDQ